MLYDNSWSNQFEPQSFPSKFLLKKYNLKNLFYNLRFVLKEDVSDTLN